MSLPRPSKVECYYGCDRVFASNMRNVECYPGCDIVIAISENAFYTVIAGTIVAG